MKTIRILSTLVLSLLAVSSSAFAQEATSSFSPRLKWGVGGFVGVDPLAEPEHSLGTNLVATYGRVGVKWNNLLGTEVEAAAGLGLFNDEGHGTLWLEVTPLDWLQLSAGPVVGANAWAVFFLAGGSQVYAGGAARIDFLLFHGKIDPGQTRRALDIGLEGQYVAGVDQSGAPFNPGPAGFLTIGYQTY